MRKAVVLLFAFVVATVAVADPDNIDCDLQRCIDTCVRAMMTVRDIDIYEATEFCGETCTEKINHNFTSAYQQGGDGEVVSDWEYGTAFQDADAIVFGQLTTTTKGSGVLVIGDQAYEGDLEGDVWSFKWEESTESADWQNHYTGYGYAEYIETDYAVDITLTLDTKDSGSGDMKSTDETTYTYMEVETWTDEAVSAIGGTGQIPVGTWLVVDDPETGATYTASNDFETADCAESVCEVAQTLGCEREVEFDATRTDYEEEAAYGHLSTAGN